MDYNPLKYRRIPKNIDIDKLFDTSEGNKTKIKYLKEGTVYFLSLLVVDNHSLDEREDGYKRINEKVLSDIIGQKRPSQIITLLKRKGVVETKPYSKGHFSTGYRLSEKYNTGELKKIKLSSPIQERLRNHRLQQIKLDIDIETEYDYIPKQFNKNKLCFDAEEVHRFTKNLGIDLFHKTIKLPERIRGYTLKSLFNFIGRIMSITEDIDKRKFNLNFSPSNHRFHSNLTSLPRELRSFLRINGEKVIEIDISSSQPFILSSILTEEFTSATIFGYNLFSIYRELYDEMVIVKPFVPTNIKENKYYRLGVHINSTSLEGLYKFSCVDFTQDFYNLILREGKRINPKQFNVKRIPELNRDYIKSHIMNFLFERNEYYREENTVINILNSLYPDLCNLIERFNQSYGNSKFALLLQRTESYLMLGNVCKRIHKEYPDIPFFTIHDSILTTETYSQVVQNMIYETIQEITGKKLAVKVKELSFNDTIDISLIDETWNKVKVSDHERYEKIKYSLLQTNIKKGITILPENDQVYWKEIMEKEVLQSVSTANKKNG